MTEKRFWSEDYSVGYHTEIIDNDKELKDVPNPKKNLSIGEVVDLLNELAEENIKIKKNCNRTHKEHTELIDCVSNLGYSVIIRNGKVALER